MKYTDPHLKEVNQNVEAKTPDGCEECLQMGSDWVHLRFYFSSDTINRSYLWIESFGCCTPLYIA
jgi:hypothetical protein